MNVYEKRRKALLKQVPDQSCSFLFAGKPIRRSQDADYDFDINRNFYYLTGIDEQEAILVLLKSGKKQLSLLFIRDIDEFMERWNGAYLKPDQAYEVSGVDQVLFLSAFDNFLIRQIKYYGIHTFGIDNDGYGLQARTLEADDFAQQLHRHYAAYPLFNLFPLLASMRAHKDEHELSLIEDACTKTLESIQEMLVYAVAGNNEHDVEAAFHYALAKRYGTPMFHTILGSGINSTTLHYHENRAPLEEGELLLADLGGCFDYYGADITQTFPISGTFSKRQRAVYEVVLEAFNQVKAAAKPGVRYAYLNELTIDVLTKGAMKLGLIKHPDEIRKYYFHSVTHFLGLDTHDVGQTDDLILEAGMVFTDEPGLYIPEEKIGIRIETDLVITKDGCRDLCPAFDRSADAIEQMVRDAHH